MTTIPTPASSAESWDAVAAAWDEHVDYVDEHSAASTATMIERLAIQPGDRVLELAAGPGTLGSHLSDLVGAGGAVVLSDLAPGMVDVARRRNADRPNLTCEVIDASAIAREDDSFDVVLSRMGLMFAPAPDVALREIGRVLAPGGRVGFMTWGELQHNPWMTCVGMGAMLAGIVTDGPPTGPGGIFSLGDAGRVSSLLTEARFRDVVVETADVVFRAPDIDTHLQRVGSLAGPLAAALQGASPDQRATLRARVAELAAAHETADGYELPGRVLLASAKR